MFEVFLILSKIVYIFMSNFKFQVVVLNTQSLSQTTTIPIIVRRSGLYITITIPA